LVVVLVARRVQAKEWPRCEGAAGGNLTKVGGDYWITMLSDRFHISATLVETSTNVA
jgi:hypothetical protein